jgi:hypothetical protein
MKVRAAGLAAVLVSAVCALACQVDADFSDAMPAPVTLKAEDFQGEIEALDRLVFAPGPLTPARREELGRRFEALAARVKASGKSKFLLIESLELRRMGSVSKDLPADAPKTALQNNWMRIRSNLFDDRAWFARSAADLPQPR